MSRRTFLFNFSSQNPLFCLGIMKQCGHTCQKQPSTKTHNLDLEKTKSGLPGNLCLRRHPVKLLSRKSRTRRSSVEALPEPRIFDMTWDLFSFEKTSGILPVTFSAHRPLPFWRPLIPLWSGQREQQLSFQIVCRPECRIPAVFCWYPRGRKI